MSMREDFEAAIESTGIEAEDEHALEETPQEILETESLGADTEADETSAAPATGTELDTEQAPTIADGDTKKEAADNENDSIKAPIDWSPKQRESWSKVPRPIQDKIIAREQEMAQTMQGTAQARQTHDRFSQLAQSYAPVLAAEGVQDPMQAVEGLFRAVAGLRMGTPESKAQQIASMIKEYNIDIAALDSVLVGQAPQANPNAQVEQMLDQRLAPINQVFEQLTQMQQAKQQQTQQAANQSVVEFGSKAEFLNDVRADMADLIDMAAKQGRNLTLQDAYDRACTLNPEISKVLDDRKNQERILGSNADLAQKRNAGSTLNGRMTGSATSGGNLSMRDQIAAAWDNSEQ